MKESQIVKKKKRKKNHLKNYQIVKKNQMKCKVRSQRKERSLRRIRRRKIKRGKRKRKRENTPAKRKMIANPTELVSLNY